MLNRGKESPRTPNRCKALWSSSSGQGRAPSPALRPGLPAVLHGPRLNVRRGGAEHLRPACAVSASCAERRRRGKTRRSTRSVPANCGGKGPDPGGARRGSGPALSFSAGQVGPGAEGGGPPPSTLPLPLLPPGGAPPSDRPPVRPFLSRRSGDVEQRKASGSVPPLTAALPGLARGRPASSVEEGAAEGPEVPLTPRAGEGPEGRAGRAGLAATLERTDDTALTRRRRARHEGTPAPTNPALPLGASYPYPHPHRCAPGKSLLKRAPWELPPPP